MKVERVASEGKANDLLIADSNRNRIKISNSDFWVLAGIVSTVGGNGIYEGYELSPAFYSQPAILFGGLGYFAYKVFYLDRSKEAMPFANSEKTCSG